MDKIKEFVKKYKKHIGGAVDILRYGGTIPGNEPGTAMFCCPDVDTINVFRIEVVQPEQDKN